MQLEIDVTVRACRECAGEVHLFPDLAAIERWIAAHLARLASSRVARRELE